MKILNRKNDSPKTKKTYRIVMIPHSFDDPKNGIKIRHQRPAQSLQAPPSAVRVPRDRRPWEKP